jgi:ATP adenylyltransferase
MERMWTPWRLPYILSEKQPGCIFCRMLDAGDDRAELILLRGERAFLVLNRYPYNNGHLMAVPYRHVDSVDKLDTDELNDLMAMTALGVRVLRQAMQPEGYNIGINQGKVAGAGVADHVHQHIVPRWAGDTNYMSVLSDTRLIPQDLDDTYTQLQQALAAVTGQAPE